MSRRHPSALIALLVLAGCDGGGSDPPLRVFDSGPAPDGGPGGSDGGPPEEPDGGPENRLSFDPSNIGNRAHLVDFASLRPCASLRIDTDAPYASCDYRFEWLEQPGVPAPADRVAVFYVHSITGGTLEVEGAHPALVVALGPIELDGRVDVENGRWDNRYPSRGDPGVGEGAGQSGVTYRSGAGGGSFCSSGGYGGTTSSTYPGGAPGPTYGSATLEPLRLGSTGGVGLYSRAPRSGGALQLVSGERIVVGRAARVWLGQEDTDGDAVGGSSGGALLLEAPVVSIDGQIDARGGDAATAEGGGAGSRGGRDAEDGTGEGGGGGGSGFLRINTSSGTSTIAIDAAVVPPRGSPCFTEGTLAPRTEPTPPPACDARSDTPDDCEVCAAERCCDRLTGCRGDALCELCLDTPPAERGPGCADDSVFQSLRECARDQCPMRCAGF